MFRSHQNRARPFTVRSNVFFLVAVILILMACGGASAVSPRQETLIFVGAFEQTSGLPPRRLRAMRATLSACLAEVPGFAVISPEQRMHARRMLGWGEGDFLSTPFSNERDLKRSRRVARLLGVNVVLNARISISKGTMTMAPYLDAADGSRYTLPSVLRPARNIPGLLNDVCAGLPGRMEFLRKGGHGPWRNRKKAEPRDYGAGFALLENGLTNEILENPLAALKVYDWALKNKTRSAVIPPRAFVLRVSRAGARKARRLIKKALASRLYTRTALAGAFQNLGRLALERRSWKTALAHYRRAITLYEVKNKAAPIYQSAAARVGIARALAGRGRTDEAIAVVMRARAALEKHGYRNGLLFVESSITLGYLKFREGNSPEAYYAFHGAMERLRIRDGGDSIIFAMASYNTGVLLDREGRLGHAEPLIKGAHRALDGAGLMNSRLYLSVLLHRGNLLYKQNEQADALMLYRRVMLTARMLDMYKSPEYAAALYNQAVIYRRNKDTRRARRLFKSAAGIYRRLRRREDVADARKRRMLMRSPEPYLGAHPPYRNSVGFTRRGEKQIRSYTGRYNLARHSPGVRARTYAGRQDDTNVFLRDLLSHSTEAAPSMAPLRRAFLTPGSKHHRGSGIVFVDIGPAVANLKTPAVTSVKIAREFRDLQVVALDLPEQIRRWHRDVPRRAKQTLLKYGNIRILSGNGLESLKDQFEQTKNWVLSKRGPVLYDSSTPIIVRAANSIDIYVPYRFVKPSIRRLGLDFKANPVIYFFNRSILFKPRGQTRFQVVGFVSVRGFHHNRQSFSRDGAAAYTLVHRLDRIGKK